MKINLPLTYFLNWFFSHDKRMIASLCNIVELYDLKDRKILFSNLFSDQSIHIYKSYGLKNEKEIVTSLLALDNSLFFKLVKRKRSIPGINEFKELEFYYKRLDVNENLWLHFSDSQSRKQIKSFCEANLKQKDSLEDIAKHFKHPPDLKLDFNGKHAVVPLSRLCTYIGIQKENLTVNDIRTIAKGLAYYRYNVYPSSEEEVSNLKVCDALNCVIYKDKEAVDWWAVEPRTTPLRLTSKSKCISYILQDGFDMKEALKISKRFKLNRYSKALFLYILNNPIRKNDLDTIKRSLWYDESNTFGKELLELLNQIRSDKDSPQRKCRYDSLVDYLELTPALKRIRPTVGTATAIELIEKLSNKDFWDKTDFSEICKQYNITADEGVQLINSYSKSLINDVLIEDNGGKSLFIISDYIPRLVRN